MITQSDRECLNYAVRCYLIDQSRQSTTVTESKSVLFDYIAKEITYEQALNLTFNKNRDTTYLDSEALEECAILLLQNELGLVYEEVQIPESINEKYEMMGEILEEKKGITDKIKKGYKIADRATKDIGSAIKHSGRDKKHWGAINKTMGHVDNALGKAQTAVHKPLTKVMNKLGDWTDGSKYGYQDARKMGQKQLNKGKRQAFVGKIETGIGKAIEKHGIKGVGGAIAVGAAASVLGYYVYKKFISKAGKGKDPKQVKQMAAKKAVGALRTAAGKCGTDKNPAKCKAKYAKEIAKMQNKISKAR